MSFKQYDGIITGDFSHAMIAAIFIKNNHFSTHKLGRNC